MTTENTATDTGSTETATKRTRVNRPFNPDKAIAKFSRDTVKLAHDLVKKNAAEEQRATTTPELAEALFGDESYFACVKYLMNAQLGTQVEMAHGQTGGYIPAGFELPKTTKGAGAVKRIAVSDAFVAAVEAAVEKCIAVARKAGKRGAPLNSVIMRLVENDVMNDGELANDSSVNAALHGHLSSKYSSAPGIGITPVEAADATTDA